MTRIGWCPGDRTVADMLARYPSTNVVRIFVGEGKPVPTWDGPVLGQLGDKVWPHVSVKTWDRPAVVSLVDGIPAGRLLILTLDHEPEQGPAAGDPTVEQWRTEWAELVDALVGHPKRDQVLLAPVFTRYWWQKFAGDLRWLLDTPGLDAIGWDIYNDGKSYRKPDDLLTVPRAIAARTGLPYLIGELGAVRLAGDDGGTGRSAWMRAMVAAARADGAVAVCWFHKGGCDLADGKSAPEQQTWRDLIQQEASVAWYLNHALTQFRDAVNAAYPDRDKTSDGTVGDLAHQATNSDHNPDPDGSVDAWDMDVDLRSGDDPAAIEHLKQVFEAHPSSRYWIHNRQIASRSDGWVRRYYDGPNPHDHHVHWNTREGYEASDAPWQLGDDMTPAQFLALLKDPSVAAYMRALPWSYPVTANASALNVLFGQALPQLAAGLKALGEAVARESSSPDEVRALLAALPQPAPLDVDGLAAALTERFKAVLPADTAVTDEQLERVLRTVLGSVDNAPQAG